MARKSGFRVGMVMVLLLVIMTACSGGGSNPVNGPLAGGDEGLRSQGAASQAGNRELWGYWNCIIDTATGTVEAIPSRGLMLHVNAVEWMQPPGGKLSNLGVKIVDDTHWLTEGRFDLNITLTHPFPGLDQFSGFDVMGVFITDGHKSVHSQGNIKYSDGGTLDATMLNLDGYTRWWNQDEFDGVTPRIFSYIPGKLAIDAVALDAALNPYKYFAKDIGLQQDVAEYFSTQKGLRGLFPAGAAITRRYELKWPMVSGNPQLKFGYAVVASWETPTPNPPVNVPGDFPIKANALEPVGLSINDNSDLYYDDVNEVYGGSVVFDLEVYDWQGLDPTTPIPSTISRIIIEFPESPAFPTGANFPQDSSTWNVTAGDDHSSVWHVDLASVAPSAMGDTPVLIIFETNYDYDNGVPSVFPDAPLSSYFPYTLLIFGAPGVPQCEAPVPEFTDRTYIEIEDYTVDVVVPGGTDYSVDWSIVPLGDPEDWVTLPPEEQPALAITANWYTVTELGAILGDYEVCVSVYSTEGFNECCTSVTVDDLPGLVPVTGQDQLTPTQQPNQGTEPCDITVFDAGSSTTGQLLFQDTALSNVRMYRLNDDYSSVVGVSTLTLSGPAPLNTAVSWNDWHKFDVNPTGQQFLATSGSDVWPSIQDNNTYNINDPYHCWVLPFANQTGANLLMALYGDVGYNATPPSPPDPDNVAWKHIVDWTSGAMYFENREYGLMTISEEWLPLHGGYTHPGTIWAIYSWSPFNNITNNFKAVALAGMSTQYTVPGDINDIDPGLMALGTDDNMPIQADWSSSPDLLMSDIVVWYMLSSEPSGANRKIHMVLLPEDVDDPTFWAAWTSGVGIFYYDSYIGSGSPWGVDFSGGTPVDLEVMYTNKDGSGLDHTWDWVAMLVDTGTSWRVDVVRYDPFFGSIAPVASYTFTGDSDPQALDIDTVQHEIHVLHKLPSGLNPYKVTVLHFTP